MRALSIILLFAGYAAAGQTIYSDLPMGNYPVGFKIITIIDSTRVTRPEVNSVGEKNTGNRHQQLALHIWYPAKASAGVSQLTVRDYAASGRMQSTDVKLSEADVNAAAAARRTNIENFWGAVTDQQWANLASQQLNSKVGLQPIDGKTPLIIGTLREFSTTVTNEVLASNGFTVIMMQNPGFNFASFKEAALIQIPDLQYSLAWACKNLNIDSERIGAYGFSGSGFMPFFLGMFDLRVKAVADMESALFGIEVRDSDYWNTYTLSIPFMHIYARELALRDTHFSEFHKMKYSKRHHVILNQPSWHHWNVATEGYLSCIVLKNRGEQQENIRKSFAIANFYLLNFFKSYLNSDAAATKFITERPTVTNIQASLWDVQNYEPVKHGPALADLESMIRTRGSKAALEYARSTLQTDSLSGIWNGGGMNGLGYRLLNAKQYDDAIAVLTLNAELHPKEANWIDSLAEAYEKKGDKANMKRVAKIVLDLLAEKKELTDFEKALKQNQEKRMAVL